MSEEEIKTAESEDSTESSPATPSEDVTENPAATGIDVTSMRRDHYGMVGDEESQKEAKKAWKKAKRIKQLTPINVILMFGVMGFVPWYLYHDRQDLAYFFSSHTPVELGEATDYRLPNPGEQSKTVDFPDNRYVHIEGLPIRHIAVQVPGIVSKDRKLVYQLMGSSVYVQESFEDSQYAEFIAQTSPSIGSIQGVSPIDIRGRMRRFDTDDAKRYAPLRDYYEQSYGTQFCANMSDEERKRKAAMLGHGGVSIQIMPDGSVLEGMTDTHVTLMDIEPLHGRSAMVIGKDNTLLHSIDAGLTWRKAELPTQAEVTSLAFNPNNEQVFFGGKKGFIGSGKDSTSSLPLSQDIMDLAFTSPNADDMNAPRMIAVGREGLLEVATPTYEGWIPASIEDTWRFNDVLQVGNQWFVAGSRNTLMSKTAESIDDPNVSWTRDVPPFKAEWTSLAASDKLVIATGSKGAVAQFNLKAPQKRWTEFVVDDVPGIDFNYDLNSSAFSDDGKTWVAVGNKGSILVAKADASGNFKPAQRISASYTGYGVVRDILAGNSVEQALYETLQRHTEEDLMAVTYHQGVFYAVGSNSLMMTSKDGLSWTKQQLPVKHQLLRTIAFTDAQNGIIGGEKGTMLITTDGGQSWRTKSSPTERSIYKIVATPELNGSFVFAGAYGLWGFCQAVNAPCYLRSKTGTNHYRAIYPARKKQDITHLDLVTAGENSSLDHIYDAPENAGVKFSLWQNENNKIYDIFATTEELPLKPDSSRGQIVLISASDGTIYRSMDAGYTFKREETGSTHPLRHLAGAQDGSVIWAFDHDSISLEDTKGLSKWHAIDPQKNFKDGLIIRETGYLIDEQCIYKRSLEGDEIEKIACTEDNRHFIQIAKDDNKLLILGENRNDAIPVATISSFDLETQTISEPQNLEINKTQGDMIHTPNLKSSTFMVCGQSKVLLDNDLHILFSASTPQNNISDITCINNKVTVISTQKEDNTWTLSAASDLNFWSVNVGFNTADAKIGKLGDNQWWIASPSATSVPYILLTKDGHHWSWRRDRITDLHAVATADNIAVAVGDNGTVLVSEDYGLNWNSTKINTDRTLRDVCLSSDGSLGIIVGDGGVLYRAQKNMHRWSKVTSKLDFDVTSCAIADRDDRFQYYIAGKGGAIYTNNEKGLELIASPAIEDIFSIAALESGEVIAVGGVYQDPASICEEGFLIEADDTPGSHWLSFVFALILLLGWGYTIQTFVISWKHRNDPDPMENA